MEIADFIKTIEGEFEDVKPGSIQAETEFRQLDGWSSMMALIIIAKIDSEYDIIITAEELANCTTINDLFELTAAKL